MLLKYFKWKSTDPRKAAWDTQYRRGIWDYLNDNLEVERFEAVIQQAALYAPGGKMLEIGCGEGILQSRMPPGSYTKYAGIDLSKVAIRKAARLQNEQTKYICADMETYQPSDNFDLIIFNESLYYGKDPVQLLQRYVQFLEPAGHIIISIYNTPENNLLLQQLGSKFQKEAEHMSANKRGSWHCQVYAKKAFSY